MKLLRRKCLQVAALSFVLAGIAALTGPAWPQTGRPIRIIIPFPPGGAADILARILGQQIGEANNQTVIVENHPGAGASIAYELTARAVPDGNTIVVAANSVVINPLLRKTNYDPVTSFEPVCNLVTSPMVFVVNSASPYKTIGELIAAAHAKPGTLTLAALGPATTQHIAAEQFKRVTKADMMASADQVPVKSTHSTMRWHMWVVLIAGSTGSALPAVRPPNLHITPEVRRDLVYGASATGSL